MVCIYCGQETQVTNSRLQKRNNQVWRRRRCLGCQAVFSTEESPILEASMLVLNQNGNTEPFRRQKLLTSLIGALKDNPARADIAPIITNTVIGRLLASKPGAQIKTSQIIKICQAVLKSIDPIAFKRYTVSYAIDQIRIKR